jgi:two-component system response regulator (stage 0 sporulation protein F)
LKSTTELKNELVSLGLLDKSREIYRELGDRAAVSYIRYNYQLLSKIVHPDLNPENIDRATTLQQTLNRVNDLLSEISDDELVELITKGIENQTDAKKRILVVEDEFGLQDMFRAVFQMEGYDVKVAVDGDRGYEVYCDFQPDLVFTDVVMPKMSGLELVAKIREIDSNIKVIYISGFFGIKRLKCELDEEVLSYGYPCLSKPFKISKMLELVRDYLDE